MTPIVEGRIRLGWSWSWLALPGLVVGLMFTDFRPVQGVWLGAAAAAVAVVSLLWSRMPRWVAWLAIGVAVGVAALYLLAWVQLLNPSPSSGSGSGSAGPR